jgi:hypothetical protein
MHSASSLSADGLVSSQTAVNPLRGDVDGDHDVDAAVLVQWPLRVQA